MTALFLLLALLILNVPAAVGLLGLGVALDVLLTAGGITLSLPQYLCVGILLFSLPLAGVLAGSLFDSFVGFRKTSGAFTLFLPVLACAFMFTTGWWVDFAEVALSTVRETAPGKLLLLFSSAVSAAVFCAGLVAFVAMGMQLLFELPVRWLQGALRSRVQLAADALRPLTIVLVLSLAFNLVIGLCSQELWPATIAAHVQKL